MPFVAIVLLVVATVIAGWQIVSQGWRSQFVSPSFRGLGLPLFGLGLQFLALHWAEGWERIVPFILSDVMLLAFLGANWKHRSLRILALGFGLNRIPILANGGYMPITPQVMAQLHCGTAPTDWTVGLVRAGSKDIVLPASEAALWFLGDVFVLGSPFPIPVAFSLGDVVLLVGLAWGIYRLVSMSQSQCAKEPMNQ